MALDNLREEHKPFLSSQGLTDVTAAPPPQFLRRIFQEGIVEEDVGDNLVKASPQSQRGTSGGA